MLAALREALQHSTVVRIAFWFSWHRQNDTFSVRADQGRGTCSLYRLDRLPMLTPLNLVAAGYSRSGRHGYDRGSKNGPHLILVITWSLPRFTNSKSTLSPCLTLSSIFLSVSLKVMLIAGHFMLSTGPCAMVTLLFSASTFETVPEALWVWDLDFFSDFMS